MRSQYALLCAAALLVTLTACATTTGQSAPDPHGFCAVAEMITWSDLDTMETLLGIKEHNCVGAHLCGWAVTGCPAL